MTQASEIPFQPTRALKNPHVQSFLASAGPRRLVVRKRAAQLLATAETHVLDCGDGVRLMGDYNAGNDTDRGLVILIHGWEGCATSSYIVSAANALYQQGASIFRLNVRDHGPSHHLNKELFHSYRLTEVVNAVAAIQAQFPHEQNYLAGFSLGGNFALRVAAQQHPVIKLERIAAICPVIDPWNAMHGIENALWAYRWYFTRKWKKSLAKKLALFPEHDYGDTLRTARSLTDLNGYFVPHHTPFDHPEEYFNAYGVSGAALNALDVDTHILMSEDDPILDAADLAKIDASDKLRVELLAHGGHCGFLTDFRFNSWADQRLTELF